MCQAALDIRTACTLPLILDAAPGWGDPMHMHRTINMSEAAGFAAIEIEDQILPKRAHHHAGIEHMVPLELMVEKLREAVAARRDRAVGVSGIVAGAPVAGMADKLMPAAGIEVSAAGVAAAYADIVSAWLVHEADAALLPRVEALGIRGAATDTIVADDERAETVARAALRLLG